MKKVLSMVLALTLLVGCMAGLGTVANAEGDVTHVTYYSAVGAYASVLEAAIKEWNETTGKEKGIQIDYTCDVDNSVEGLRTMGETGQWPDIYDYPDENIYYAANGWTMDLNEVPGLEDLIAEYEEYLDSRYYYNGMLIGLPLEAIPCKMAVNLDLFEKNNLELPKTWDDVLECAKVITENGEGVDYGYGWTSAWTGGATRLMMEAAVPDTGKYFWDPNTATFDFSPFKDIVDVTKQLYDGGYMFPDPTELSIDGVRAQFSEGHIGMIIAYGYDIGVYNNQFPAKCNWTIINCPTMTEDPPYKYLYEPRSAYGISVGAEDHLEAVAEVFKFLSSDELYQRIYKETGAMIPINSSVLEGVTPDESIKNIAEMADLENFAPYPCNPYSMVTIDGDPFQTVLFDVVYGNADWDEAVEDLNERYNAAYQELKESGEADTSRFEYEYDLSR